MLAGGISEFEAGHLGTFGGVLPALENFLVILGGVFITTGMYWRFVPLPNSVQGAKEKSKEPHSGARIVIINFSAKPCRCRPEHLPVGRNF